MGPLSGIAGRQAPAAVFGANCYESDLLCENIPVSVALRAGDPWYIGEVGAYDMATSEQWIHERPRIYVRVGGRVWSEAMR
jgi:diaminopimelate decarboxylase